MGKTDDEADVDVGAAAAVKGSVKKVVKTDDENVGAIGGIVVEAGAEEERPYVPSRSRMEGGVDGQETQEDV